MQLEAIYIREPKASFVMALDNARKQLDPQDALNLGDYAGGEYDAGACYVSADGLSGFAVLLDGTLVNVFSLVKGRGDNLVQRAIKAGATKLDCFDGHLPRLYGRNGFVEVKRLAFDPQYAPDGWDSGTPDVVFMERKAA